MALAADHQMVVQADADGLQGVAHGPGHLDVGFRGRRVARGVVVDQSPSRKQCIELNSVFDIWRNRWGMSLGSVIRDPA